MPVLTREISTKKIVLPASSQPKDEAWIEIEEKLLMDHYYEVDMKKGQFPVATQVLAKMIKSWNFTDEKGNALPITEDNVRLLPMADIAYINTVTGLEEKFKEMSKQKKRS